MAEISYSIYVAKDIADGKVCAVLGIHNYSTGVGDLVAFTDEYDTARLAQILVVDDYAREAAQESAGKMNPTGTLYKADGTYDYREMKWPEPEEAQEEETA